MLTVTFFTRKGCHLCDQALEELQALQSDYPHQVVEVDIESSPDLLKEYGFEIPVVQVGPYTLKAPFDQSKLAMTLGAAHDRQTHIAKIAETAPGKKAKPKQDISGADRFSLWLSRHYLLVFNLFVLVYVGLPFLAPVLLKAGAETPANLIYRLYSGLCHQLSYRSWFIFGEQPIYPREAAGIEGYLSFHEATGLDEHGLLDARAFLGNEFTGYKIALCQRDVAIYLSILLFGVLFSLTGRKFKPLPLWIWLLVGIVPIGVDGFSQLLSQFISYPELAFLRPVLGFLPYRESTPFLRTLTGFLFGFSTAWFGYPLVEETMADARRLLTVKLAKISEN